MNNNRRPGLVPAPSQPKISPKNITIHNNKPNTIPKSNITQKINRVGDGSRIPTTGKTKSNDTNHTTRTSDKDGMSGDTSDNTAYANESVDKNSTQLQTTVSNPKPNYATATAKENNPQRDQAIIFNSIEGIPQIDYIRAIGQIVSPKNILFVSRISNNRFCIFLNNKHTVDSLVEKTKFITINDNAIQIRRLINTAKRIVISNVCPSIPNEKILAALQDINIIPTSQINYIKAGVVMEGYEHVLSFRRQMYINDNDIPKLPGSLVINHDETNFRIFFTDDRITCYTCKTSGHTTLSCKKYTKNPDNNMIKNQSASSTNWDIDSSLQTEMIEDTLPPMSPNLDEIPTDINMDASRTPVEAINILKRPASMTTTPSNPTSPRYDSSQEINTTIKPPKKVLLVENKIDPNHPSPSENRSRSNSRNRFSENLDSHLESIKHLFDDKTKFKISFDQFMHIIENIHKQDNPLNIIQEYGLEGSEIITIFEITRPYLTTKIARNNFTRITNKIFKALGAATTTEPNKSESNEN
jgi:hypothetical protein